MDFVTLRRAGGSLTLTIPKALVRALGLAEGTRVGVTADGGKLIAEPAAPERLHYTLDELIAACDPNAPLSPEDEAWLGAPPRGNELI